MLAIIVTALVTSVLIALSAVYFYETKIEKIEAAHAADIKSIKASVKQQCQEAYDNGVDTVRRIAIDEITKARMS